MTRRKSNRLDPFKKGMKEGAIKKSVDKAISPITSPVAEAINRKLQEMHPNAELAAPMVQSAIKCAIIMGFAELLDVAAPFIEERTNFDPEKVDLASGFMRKLAGEKVGAEVVDLAIQFVPIIMSAFAEFQVSDLREAVQDLDDEDSFVSAEQNEGMYAPVSKLEVDEEEKISTQKKGRLRKKRQVVEQVA
jgi:hypothetical protein